MRATVGIESLVWLVDVVGLTSDAAIELLVSSAQALLRAALADTSAATS